MKDAMNSKLLISKINITPHDQEEQIIQCCKTLIALNNRHSNNGKFKLAESLRNKRRMVDAKKIY